MKKRNKQLLVLAVVVILIVAFRNRIRGLFSKGGIKLPAGPMMNGGGGGGGFGGATSVPVSSVNVGPYTYQGATAASGYANIGYKPTSGSGVTALPSWCVSDAFTLNGVDYCVALDSRGNEVTRKIN